jgi:hypothetical protein
VINDYLRGDDRVLGLVEMGGLMIEAEDERIYRAEGVVVAAILPIDGMFTENHGLLRTLAAEYGALAIRPHSEVPEDYRSECRWTKRTRWTLTQSGSGSMSSAVTDTRRQGCCRGASLRT